MKLKFKDWLLYEPKDNFSDWLKFALLLGLFSIFMYFPAFGQNYEPLDDYQGKNLSGIVTGILNVSVDPTGYSSPDYPLSWEMQTARDIVRGIEDNFGIHTSDPQYKVAPPSPQVPLWRWDDSDGGRPLLVVSPGPFLYPFTALFYFGDLAYFAAFHFWLALVGFYFLSTYFPVKLKLFARPLLLFLIVIYLPQLRFDYAAGLAWWLVGLTLALTLAKKRFSIQLASLSFIFAMLLLAVSMPISLVLIATLAVWWLLVAGWKNNWHFVPIIKGLAGLILAVIIGTMLSGPQLFPRLFDRMEPYQLPPDQTPIYLPAQVILNGVTRVSETEVVYNLSVEGSTSLLQLTIPERYDQGWTAEYRVSSSSSGYQTIPLKRTAQGWRTFTVPPITSATSLEIRTKYDPASFRIGVWSFMAGLALWLVISGVAVYSSVAKTLHKHPAVAGVKVSKAE